MSPRQIDDLLGEPRIVIFFQAEMCHLVFAVSIKAGGDEDEFRLEIVEPRQTRFREGSAIRGTVRSRRQQHVDDARR